MVVCSIPATRVMRKGSQLAKISRLGAFLLCPKLQYQGKNLARNSFVTQ